MVSRRSAGQSIDGGAYDTWHAVVDSCLWGGQPIFAETHHIATSRRDTLRASPVAPKRAMCRCFSSALRTGGGCQSEEPLYCTGGT